MLAVDAGELAKQGYFTSSARTFLPTFSTCHHRPRIAPGRNLWSGAGRAALCRGIVGRGDHDVSPTGPIMHRLTGGIFSRSPANLDRVERELLVGNLYLNRPITGALVARQPFGGFKMSGIGSQAGGADYLLQFVIPRTVTENTMRRGFAPASVRRNVSAPFDAGACRSHNC